jgi:uncharacterized protein
MKKNLILTHDDLDGIGCAIVMALLKDIDSNSNVFLRPEQVDVTVEALLTGEVNSFSNYNNVYVTDLSISYELCEKIKAAGITNFFVYDHHKSAMKINDFDFCKVVDVDEFNKPQSAAKLLFKEFKDDLYLADRLEYLVQLISDYDTYEWKRSNLEEPKMLHALLGVYDRNRFIDHCGSYLRGEIDLFRELEKFVLLLEAEKETAYIENMKRKVIKVDVGNYKIGFFFAARYVSLLLNTVCEENPDIDLSVSFNPTRMSYEMRTIKDNVDLSSIAKQFNGGGHPKAAGFPVEEGTVTDMINLALGKFNKI